MPKISDLKLEAGIFDGPQIRMLFNGQSFIVHMTGIKKDAWTSFRKVCDNFLGNKKSQDYKKLVTDMIKNFQILEKLNDFSEEQGERSHQDIKDFDKRYQGVWDTNMMADYYWSMKRDVNSDKENHKRRSLHRSFQEIQVQYHKRNLS